MPTEETEKPTGSEPIVAPAQPKAAETVGNKEKELISEKSTLREYVKDVIFWKNPMTSAKFLFVTFMMFHATCGSNGYSVLGFITMLFIQRTLIVFSSNFFGKKLKEHENAMVQKVGTGLLTASNVLGTYANLPSEESIKFFISGTAEYMQTRTSAAMKAIKTAESDVKLFRIVLGHLLVFQVTLWFFSLHTLFFVGCLVSLTVPVFYKKFQKQIDPVLKQMKAKADPHLAQLKQKATETMHLVENKVKEGLQKKTVDAKKDN